jgi:hypothetical protein
VLPKGSVWVSIDCMFYLLYICCGMKAIPLLHIRTHHTQTVLFLIVVLLSVLYCNTASAQYAPAENSILHYRLAGFSFSKLPPSKKYTLEIATGQVFTEDSFARAIIFQQEYNAAQAIVTLPYWHQAYTWRVTSVGNNKKASQHSRLLHFQTAGISFTDTSLHRLRVSTNKMVNKSLYVFSDGNRALYDMNGNPVWYVPFTPGLPDTSTPLRDVKMTPQHTITFIANTQAYEIDYNGNLLWKAPDNGKISGDTSEFYHHEFTRLKNGHYMIAGNEYARKYLPASFATQYPDNDNVKQENGQYYVDVAYGTLIEYDAAKNIIWSWKSSTYFTDAELITPALFENSHLPGFHFNGFFVDENKHAVYNSFRDINKIIKINYPDKKPLAEYSNVNGKQLLMGQHNCRINKDGNLYLFNNNFANNGKRMEGPPSSVLILKEPGNTKDEMTIEYAFDCDIDKEAGATAKGGGSVGELADGSILVCMGTVNRMFIVRDKDVLWNAFTEMKNEGRWLQQSNYRVSAVEGMDDLMKLIFNNK